MSAQHTPGPWHVVSVDHAEAICDERGATIADVFGMSSAERGIETDANARLIAAAPDLLALLVRALPAVRTWAGMVRRSNGTHSAKSADADNLVHEIRAALAKVLP